VRRLTERRIKILEAIRQYYAAHGYPPTLREIGEMVGLRSVATVYTHVRALLDMGYLRTGGAARPRTLIPKERVDGDLPDPEDPLGEP